MLTITSNFSKKLNLKNFCFIILIHLLKPFDIFFNLTNINKTKSCYAKAAGVFCKLIALNLKKKLALIQLPTSQRKNIKFNILIIKGRSSNIFHKNEIKGKAGYSRLLNIRPTTRGVAMNPVDHPHGGRTKTNSPELTPWNKIAKFNK